MVKKSTPVKRKSSSKKQVPKKTFSSKRIAKAAGLAALGTGLGYAAYKGAEKYKQKKVEIPTPTVYDNVMSFFGFNKKAQNVDTCQNELNKLKEELNNAKKNDNSVNQCNNELTKIQKELAQSKVNLDNYKKYETAIEKEVTVLENENKKLKQLLKDKQDVIEEYEKSAKTIMAQVNALEEENNTLKKQNAIFQKKLVTGR